ncbi:MAG: four helix bundle protein [Candidatus Saccharibacteria bacterium]|nr:four helix bundle protein [Candidatus Saccharibacteria bacterium]
MKSFTDLKAWQKAHNLTLDIYKLTNDFPSTEQFGLSNQMRRAAVSACSNLAEGFGRSTAKDTNHFYIMSSGSLYELKSQALLAKDLTYVSNTEFVSLADKLNQTHKLVNGLLRHHKNSATNP